MLYFFLTFFTQIEVGAFRTLIHNSGNWDDIASLALNSCMYHIGMDGKDWIFSLEDLLLQAGKKSVESLVN